MENEKKFPKGKWSSVYSDGWKILFDSGLTSAQWNVFAFLMHRLGYDNWVHVKQKDIADALGMYKANVSRAISSLALHDVIVSVGDSVYMVNPRIACRGKSTSRLYAIYEQQKRKGEDDGAFGNEEGVDSQQAAERH